jgi:hypothetical protein
MDGTNGSTTFTDSSLNALTITPTSATISTSQAKYGASGFFNGTSAYLTAASSAITLGTSDFTIEFWIYPLDVRTFSLYDSRTNETNPNGNGFVIGTSASQAWVVYQGANRIVGPTVVANQWTHVAVTRSGSSVKMYINGTQVGSTWTTTGSFSDGATLIGTDYPKNARFVNGYIDDFRISRFARYVSNFTPPTAALPTTASSTVADPYYNYTSLLLHMDGAEGGTSFTDNSSNALTVTSSSVTTTSTGAKSGFGQAGDFPGTSSSSLTIPASSGFNFGTGNFTIEFWFNIPAGASGSPYGKTLVSNENNVWSAGAFSLYALASSTQFRPSFWINEFSGSVPILIPSSGDYRDGNWHHFAIVRNGSAFAMYIDGSLAASGTHSGNCGSSTRNLMIGDNLANNGGDRNFLGKLDDLRITKYARYTANFTPPTTAFPNA